jgi:hypothetical protein
MIKGTSPRGKQDDWTFWFEVIDCLEERFWLHNHACPSSVGKIINRAVLIVRIGTKIREVILHQASLSCATRDR